jgi:hypothetical protein
MKIYKEMIICTQEGQDIRIAPTPEFDGLELSYKESGDTKYLPNLFLSKEVLEELKKTLDQMMDYSITK